MSATTTRGITYPTVGDTLTPLANRFATLATTTDTAIGNLATPSASFKGTDATRLALGAATVPVLANGLEWYSTDTGRRWFYNGSAWTAFETGDFIVAPTSVVGGTLQSDGSVTFSAATSVSLNGVFTSRFRTYHVKWAIDTRTVTGGTGVEALRLRAAGTDASGANYGWKRVVIAGGTISNTANTADNSWSSHAASGYAQSDKMFRLERPGTAVATRISMVSTGPETDGSSIDGCFFYGGYHTVATAYDGCTLFVPAGAITGSISVHGIV